MKQLVSPWCFWSSSLRRRLLKPPPSSAFQGHLHWNLPSSLHVSLSCCLSASLCRVPHSGHLARPNQMAKHASEATHGFPARLRAWPTWGWHSPSHSVGWGTNTLWLKLSSFSHLIPPIDREAGGHGTPGTSQKACARPRYVINSSEVNTDCLRLESGRWHTKTALLFHERNSLV